ncbi:zinc carboxypeptidase family [Stylonychia lemnae]|uniref:Zinc carboxypeptidase family n=1 Tax=Stylonychia lemnae TaxID=5949 RepID=A0A078B6L7_STYLE|nr:zinc carboxypeptidase family [Stylonychia lemnae]|eukprot:CDW88922.1 zinc carboxypeptidase family [Stylonychia lemnae]
MSKSLNTQQAFRENYADDGEIIEGSEDDGEEMSDSQDGDGSITQSGQKSKHKRRSKNDNQGRNFKCGCGKKYLSYPALYTHIKTKHNGQTPTGTNTSQFQTGRGRGRPRKIQTLVQDKEEQMKFQSEAGLLQQMKQQMGQLSYLESHLTEEKLQKERDLIQKLNAVGGPTNPLEWYYEKFEDDEDELYMLVQQQQNIIQQALRQMNIEAIKSNIHKGTLYLANLTDEERLLLNLDQILAIYLIDISEYVIVNFYKALSVFVQLYRNCMNEIGWDFIANFKIIDNPIEVSKNLQQFTTVKEADYIPQISNEFLVSYLPKKCNSFEKRLAIPMIEHLCTWLLNRKFTQLKLSLF